MVLIQTTTINSTIINSANKLIKFIFNHKRLIILLLFVVLLLTNHAFSIEPQDQKNVKNVVEAFKNNDRMTLSKLVSYPLFRQAPLAPINNQKEFLERYDEVFDAYLLNKIIQSNIHTDWDSIGWKGVILENGIVALDPEGNIIEINHHSQHERTIVSKLNSNKIAKGRRAPSRSTANYNQAVVELSTKRFHIRVDNLDNGMLRYTSWPINKQTTDAPDLILSNGRVIDGNGRNQRYVFDNGTYSYQLNINKSGKNNHVTGSLEVFKSGQSWIREVATKVVRK